MDCTYLTLNNFTACIVYAPLVEIGGAVLVVGGLIMFAYGTYKLMTFGD